MTEIEFKRLRNLVDIGQARLDLVVTRYLVRVGVQPSQSRGDKVGSLEMILSYLRTLYNLSPSDVARSTRLYPHPSDISDQPGWGASVARSSLQAIPNGSGLLWT